MDPISAGMLIVRISSLKRLHCNFKESQNYDIQYNLFKELILTINMPAEFESITDVSPSC